MAKERHSSIFAEPIESGDFKRGTSQFLITDSNAPRHLDRKCGFDIAAAPYFADAPARTISVQWKQAALHAMARLADQAELRRRQYIRIKSLAEDFGRLEEVVHSHEVRINSLAASITPTSACENVSEFVESLGIESVFDDVVAMTRRIFGVDPSCGLENDVDTPGRQYIVLEVSVDVDVDVALNMHEEWHRFIASKLACRSVFSLAVDIINGS